MGSGNPDREFYTEIYPTKETPSLHHINTNWMSPVTNLQTTLPSHRGTEQVHRQEQD